MGIALGLIAVSPKVSALASSSPLTIRASLTADIGPSTLLATLSNPGAAGWLGQRYLADHPYEQNANRLIDQLSAALDAYLVQFPIKAPPQAPTDSTALSQVLSALIQYEYRSVPLLTVDGWLLAPSEARLYALAALTTTHRQAALPRDLTNQRMRPRPSAHS
ncbi:MAG: hypothetical protein C1943_16720 [Halochromatium sp.]|nr:hypothetical protein [Halochromatium sp.]